MLPHHRHSGGQLTGQLRDEQRAANLLVIPVVVVSLATPFLIQDARRWRGLVPGPTQSTPSARRRHRPALIQPSAVGVSASTPGRSENLAWASREQMVRPVSAAWEAMMRSRGSWLAGAAGVCEQPAVLDGGPFGVSAFGRVEAGASTT